MVWNFFAVAPLTLAALLLPGSRSSKLPAAPFVLGSAALGYFALGPYMITRNPSRGAVSKSELGFVTRNGETCHKRARRRHRKLSST
jgi:hypothetical protein